MTFWDSIIATSAFR